MIELLVVIVIITILATMVAGALFVALRNAQRKRDETQKATLRFALSINRFIAAYPPSDYAFVLHEALHLCKHPVLLFRMEGHSFFGAVLPYQEHFVSLFPVPGFGTVGADGLKNFLDLANSAERIPFERFKIGIVVQRDGAFGNIREFWEKNAM